MTQKRHFKGILIASVHVYRIHYYDAFFVMLHETKKRDQHKRKYYVKCNNKLIQITREQASRLDRSLIIIM